MKKEGIGKVEKEETRRVYILVGGQREASGEEIKLVLQNRKSRGFSTERKRTGRPRDDVRE